MTLVVVVDAVLVEVVVMYSHATDCWDVQTQKLFVQVHMCACVWCDGIW